MAKRPRASGAPGWMVTFADLMALMLTFFVLLLSMSVIDIQRFQQAMLSLQFSFASPSGNIGDRERFIIGEMAAPPTPLPIDMDTPDPIEILDDNGLPDLTKSLYEELVSALAAEIEQGYMELERDELQILLRFPQSISFQLASADLESSFIPILDKIAVALTGVDGSILVVGHTDDLPIRTVRFRSNWDLSSARAASVVHYLLENSELDNERIIAAGRAYTQPLVPNDSMENREKNRRVEVIIRPEDLRKGVRTDESLFYQYSAPAPADHPPQNEH